MSRILVSALVVSAVTSGARADRYAIRGVVQKLPRISLNERFDPSPQTVQLDVAAAVPPNEVEYFCGDNNTLLVPLAHVHLVTAGDWMFAVDAPGMTLYMIERDRCFTQLDGSELPAGDMVLWGRIASAPPLKLKLDVHLVPAPPAVKIELGADLSRPVAVKVEIAGGKLLWQPLEITSSGRHHIRLYALGAPHGEYRFGHMRRTKQQSDDMVRPDEPLAIDVMSKTAGPVYVVVEEPNKTAATEADIYGAPDDSAPLADRDLSKYSLLNPAQGMTRDTADLAARLFTAVDLHFVVYASEAHNLGCRLVAGEPLLVFAYDEVMHANGRVERCSFQVPERFADVVTTAHPAKLVMPAIEDPRSDQNERIWRDEDFLAQADRDKGIAAYKQAKANASACYSREWARLDPDGKADQYDIVTTGQNGQVTKVEGYGDRIFRQVSATCHLSAIEVQRDAIYKRLAKTFHADEQKRLNAIAQRLGGL